MDAKQRESVLTLSLSPTQERGVPPDPVLCPRRQSRGQESAVPASGHWPGFSAHLRCQRASAVATGNSENRSTKLQYCLYIQYKCRDARKTFKNVADA